MLAFFAAYHTSRVVRKNDAACCREMGSAAPVCGSQSRCGCWVKAAARSSNLRRSILVVQTHPMTHLRANGVLHY